MEPKDVGITTLPLICRNLEQVVSQRAAVQIEVSHQRAAACERAATELLQRFLLMEQFASKTFLIPPLSFIMAITISS